MLRPALGNGLSGPSSIYCFEWCVSSGLLASIKQTQMILCSNLGGAWTATTQAYTRGEVTKRRPRVDQASGLSSAVMHSGASLMIDSLDLAGR